MIHKIEMVERGAVPRVMQREFTAWKRKVFLDVAGAWHREMRPGHFAAGAAGKYGYVARSRNYMIRKARFKKHQRPLVWSGRTEEMSKLADIRSTARGGRVVMRVPALNFRPFRKKGGGDVVAMAMEGFTHAKLRDELTVVLPAEVGVLAGRAERLMGEFMKRVSETNRERV